MIETPNYYAIITADVRYDKNLKANEKLLYGEITALAQASGNCFASNEYFANLYGTSKETVSRWISNLKKCGYVDVIITYKNDGKTIDKRIITLLTKKSIPSCEKSQYPIDENIKENNTRINNTSLKEEKINKKENLFENLIAENEYYDIYEDIANDFISHRKQIKKPLKTTGPLKAFIDALVELSKLGYSFEYCIKQMKSNEWQTVKVDYIHKPVKAQSSFTQPKSKVQKTNEFIDDFFGRMAGQQQVNEIIDTEILS